MQGRYKVNVGKHNKYFDTVEQAEHFRSLVFQHTGILLSVVCRHAGPDRSWINRKAGQFRCLACGYQYNVRELEGV